MVSDAVWAVLEPALKRAGTEVTSREQVAEAIASGWMQLFTEGRSAAVGVGIGPCYRIGLAGGDMVDMPALEAMATRHAQANGYRAVEIVGREGWERVFPEYKRASVILRKELGT